VSALIVEVRTAPAPTLVTVAGEIDILTAPELRDQVRTLPDGDIVLDFSGVGFLAAAGLRVLLDLRDRRARAGMQVVLAAPSPSVQRVLVVTKLAHTLSMATTVDDAVALITAAPCRGGSADPRNATDGHCVASPLTRRLGRMRDERRNA
jgi:anti-sigma B factor antagonist